MGWQDHRHAPPPGTLLCTAAIPAGSCTELSYGEGDATFSILLYRRGTDIKAYVNCCPHFSLPLNSSPGKFLMLEGERVMCAYHCAIFRLQDGLCIDGPAEGMGLDSIPIEIRDGQIYMGLR